MPAAAPAPVKNRAPLAESAFYRLPLTSVKPAGWLRGQLQLQSQAITGHLDEFWPDVGANSAWLGGSGEGWERGPYYLDGLVPLAYLLNDPRLIAKTRPWIEWTITHQSADGAIGPAKNHDWWPTMIMLKVLTQYQEATGDARVIPVMEKYFAYQSRILAGEPIPVFNRGKMRRDFSYIDDIVPGVLAALDRPPADTGKEPPAALYNLGNSQAEDLLRFIDVLERALGKKAVMDFQPMQPGDVTETYADIGASTRDLGFNPATSIEQGIPKFVEWYRGYYKA